MKFIEIKCVLKHATMLLMCVFVLTVMTACGAKNADEAVSKEDEIVVAGTEDTLEDKLGAEEQIEKLHSRCTYIEESSISVSQPGNYIIDGVELCDAVEASPEMNSAWEGYSEEELGFLGPDKMPNCTENEDGCHYVFYDSGLYVYVNDFNTVYRDHSHYTEYANVWVGVNDGRILGGLEEYGKACAQKSSEVELADAVEESSETDSAAEVSSETDSAAVASSDINSKWGGYTEEELGYLSPDKMPNCEMNDEGIHFIVYNGVTYFYVNDLNNILLSYSSAWEYADVWIAADSDRILGGLEKYGRECAKKRDD